MAKTIEDEKFQIVEHTDLEGIGKVHIDEVIEYVHTGYKKLPSPIALYERYLKQRWNVYELDFTQDAVDWHEKMTEEERQAFVDISSGFHHGERQVEVTSSRSCSPAPKTRRSTSRPRSRTKRATPSSSTGSTRKSSAPRARRSWTSSTASYQ